MGRFIDITGQRFGRLVVTRLVDRAKSGRIKYLCLCNCGKEKIIVGDSLRRGLSKSCGCLQKERVTKHGHNKNGKDTRTYRSWHNMKERCINPNNPSYHNYGERGITVCKEWLEFPNFLKDMGERPRKLTLERIKNNKGYCKFNCKWTTGKEQNRNTRRNHLVTYNSKTQCIAKWSEETGIPYHILWQRLCKSSWSIKKTLTIPVKEYKRKKTNG